MTKQLAFSPCQDSRHLREPKVVAASASKSPRVSANSLGLLALTDRLDESNPHAGCVCIFEGSNMTRPAPSFQ